MILWGVIKMRRKHIELDLDEVDSLFKSSRHQNEVIDGLHKMIFPDWDEVEKMEGWPTVNPETWKYIAWRFREFDIKHFRDVVPGGAWVNRGFSSDTSVPAGYVDISTCKLKYTLK